MKVIKSVTIEGAKLNTSNLVEPDATYDPPAWNAATNYGVGDLVARSTTHMVYRRLDPGGTDATLPENAPTLWKPIYAVNKWAMFDKSVGSKSRKSGAGLQSIVVKVRPGEAVNSMAFFELEATTVRVRMYDNPGGAVVFDQTINLDVTPLLDWYMYFFEPFSLRNTFTLFGLPPYPNCEIEVTISKETSVAAGTVVFGTVYTTGSTAYGVTAGIRDFSKKDEDEQSGVITLEQGRFRKTMRARFKLDESQVNFVHNLLSSLRATPCVWIGDNGVGLEPLIVYGFYRDFQLDLPGPKHSYYSLEVEGMV